MFSKKTFSVITFHGFGQSDSFGREVQRLLKYDDVENCRLMYHHDSEKLIDHGKSKPFEIKRYLETKGIKCDNFQVVIGYSLGTRLALSYVKYFPDKVNQLILIAPDCFRPQKVYRFATTSIGLLLFKILTLVPFPIWILNFVPKYQRMVKTIEYLWGNKSSRRKLLLTWKYYANWFWNEQEALKFLSQHNIEVIVVSAINDEVGLDGRELKGINMSHLTKITMKSSHMNLWRVFLKKASISGDKLVFEE